MADTADVETYSQDASEYGREKSGGKKKLMLVVLSMLIIGGGGAGLYFSGILNGLKDNKKAAADADKPAAPRSSAKSVYFDLPDMLVNLNSDEAKPHFLKFRASLELETNFDVTVLLALQPRIIDKFQVYMRELRLDDLRANVGMVGLRKELLGRINDVVKPVKARDVLFRNILVQ